MSNSTLTPYRKTKIRFDVSETIQIEPAFSMTRSGDELNIDQIPGALPSVNVRMIAGKLWVITSLQETLSWVHERTSIFGAIIDAVKWAHVSILAPNNRWRKNRDLPGVTYSPEVSESGDEFLSKSVPAGKSWAESLDADVVAYGQPVMPTADAPMARIAITKGEYQENQPIFHRFVTPGTVAHAPDLLCTLYFGGPTTPSGHGQFACAYFGDGMMALFERIDGVWGATGFEWRYCEPHKVSGASHSIKITPAKALDGTGGYIEFVSSVNDISQPRSSLVTSYIRRGSSPRSAIYNIKFKAPDLRSNVTGLGKIRLDERVDIRCHHQISVIRYHPSGRLVDQPWSTGFYTSNRTNFKITWFSDEPDGTFLDAKIYDAATHTECPFVSQVGKTKTYTPTQGGSSYYVVFDFLPDLERKKTPKLKGYQVIRDGVQEQNSPGEFASAASNYSFSGPERDPSHETASALIRDVKNESPLLRVRSMIPAIIETEYHPTDTTKKSYLFRGYSARCGATKRGTAGRLYPSPEWRDYDITFMGAWARLHEMLSFARFDYGNDGTGQPWKVTDVIRFMLTWCGYSLDEVDVPDNPIRFFPVKGSNEGLTIKPLTNISEFVAEATKNYLGWHLVFDANAGDAGMWRAMPPSLAPYTNLAEFSTSGPPTANKLVSNPGSYGSTNWVGTDIARVKAFIKRGTFVTEVKPPEANSVFVAGHVDPSPSGQSKTICTQWAANPKSYNFFSEDDGTVIESADPAHPDYLGRMVPIIVLDGGLFGQAAVDWACRRIYDVACHGIKMATFTAPLVLVTNTTDAKQTRPRPLRYYDPVLVNGEQFLIRNCNPSYTKDSVQMATYECQAPSI